MATNPTEDRSVVPTGIERRRQARHRFIVDLNISNENGTAMHGMSFEIGAGAMSAATSGRLEMGDQVILYPVIRARVMATVRRRNGLMDLNSSHQPLSFSSRFWRCAKRCRCFRPWLAFENYLEDAIVRSRFLLRIWNRFRGVNLSFPFDAVVITLGAPPLKQLSQPQVNVKSSPLDAPLQRN